MPKARAKVFVERMEKVKEFIMRHWIEFHNAPSVNAVAEVFGVSTSVATYWREYLEKIGWLEPYAITHALVPTAIFKDRPVFPQEGA